jgi:hypothetical protein
MTCNAKTIKGQSCKNKCMDKLNYCKIHNYIYKIEKPEDCLICCESLKREKYPLSCGHWIHKECIYKWSKKQCPVCTLPIKLTKKESRIFELYRKEIELDIILDLLRDVIFDNIIDFQQILEDEDYSEELSEEDEDYSEDDDEKSEEDELSESDKKYNVDSDLEVEDLP